MSRPGDWNCRSCSYLNFQRRESCQRCGEGRSGDQLRGGGDFGGRLSGGGGGFGFTTGPDVRPGDWYCGLGNCNAHNFASRANCYKCGASKEDSSSSSAAAGGYDPDTVPRGRAVYGFGSSGGGGGGGGSSRSGWKSGDWICTRSGCNEHNFASRMECFRCSAPRDTNASKSPY